MFVQTRGEQVTESTDGASGELGRQPLGVPRCPPSQQVTAAPEWGTASGGLRPGSMLRSE